VTLKGLRIAQRLAFGQTLYENIGGQPMAGEGQRAARSARASRQCKYSIIGQGQNDRQLGRWPALIAGLSLSLAQRGVLCPSVELDAGWARS
jgi:hypothetical protein